MKFLDQKIEVLHVGELEESPPTSRTKWHRTTVQLFDGDLAGQQQIYGEKDQLSQLQKGWYLVDVTGRHGDYGRIEYSMSNHRPIKSQATQPASINK